MSEEEGYLSLSDDEFLESWILDKSILGNDPANKPVRDQIANNLRPH